MLLVLWVNITAQSPEQRTIIAAERVDGAVVGVMSTRDNELTGETARMGFGSGVIFEIEGKVARIVTNDHVLDYGNTYEIVLPNGKQRKAEVVGRDQFSDLAVLEMNAQGIRHVAKFGNSKDLQRAETVIAIGNPLSLGFSQTITVGVVSSTSRVVPVSLSGRMYDWEMELIQTDAAINHGNSGGALVDLQGTVIGINSMKVADMGVEGIGFAIPIHVAEPIIESLIEHGKVLRPYMGVSTEDLDIYLDTMDEAEIKALGLPEDMEDGLVIIEALGPSAEAGLEEFDVITHLDRQRVASILELRRYLYGQKEIGDRLRVRYYRGEEQFEAVITLEELDG